RLSLPVAFPISGPADLDDGLGPGRRFPVRELEARAEPRPVLADGEAGGAEPQGGQGGGRGSGPSRLLPRSARQRLRRGRGGLGGVTGVPIPVSSTTPRKGASRPPR